jgi:hypothetical protein
MRKLIESTLVSLDGVIEAPERWANFDAEATAFRTVPGTPKRLSLGHPADCRSPADRALCPGGFSHKPWEGWQ